MKKLLIIIISLILIPIMEVNAQCKIFTKNECKPLLEPYIYNGQLNTAILSEGDFAELLITFYSNLDYRIVVCSEAQLKNINFKLLDLKGNEIFSNAEHNFTSNWDFSTNTTQQLRIEISVPTKNKDKSSEEATGCVSILVGFKEKNTK